ncbi:MAG: hypothetical protein A3E51_01620 [Burkholderiales bacterium RIFCSPHIGHO2_12_FULL_67_38]|nr:MAG: hypothetical protein A3I64_08170 [Burkholderiales bacterium RIFCSPLOWO2_02_FULL_67_64]OGB44702.1 MAG: hypothetical protein A3E51_01620 [Burkholderiales bacterium RIFCSPHIGHO2_12_FULL_67_38]
MLKSQQLFGQLDSIAAGDGKHGSLGEASENLSLIVERLPVFDVVDTATIDAIEMPGMCHRLCDQTNPEFFFTESFQHFRPKVLDLVGIADEPKLDDQTLVGGAGEAEELLPGLLRLFKRFDHQWVIRAGVHGREL